MQHRAAEGPRLRFRERRLRGGTVFHDGHGTGWRGKPRAPIAIDGEHQAYSRGGIVVSGVTPPTGYCPATLYFCDSHSSDKRNRGRRKLGARKTTCQYYNCHPGSPLAFKNAGNLAAGGAGCKDVVHQEDMSRI